MNIILKNENLYGRTFSMDNQKLFPDELIRLEIKKNAEDVRYKYSKKGLSDIFDILSEDAFLLRMPLKTTEVSGFSTYFQDKFVVFLNSSFTLGHERYSGAHELYHIIYNQEILKNEKLLLNDPKTVEDIKADIFAAEFLMPEDYVKEVFCRAAYVGGHVTADVLFSVGCPGDVPEDFDFDVSINEKEDIPGSKIHTACAWSLYPLGNEEYFPIIIDEIERKDKIYEN